MNTKLFITALIAIVFTSCQNPKTDITNNKNTTAMQEIQDKMALRELVDNFSNLSDEKKVTEQMELFIDDAEVISISDGQISSQFKGKKEIGDAFSNFLALFHTVYHINGQHTAKINGDTAIGIYYCQVVLIGNQDGKNMGRFSGIRYNDEYVKIDGKWFIKKRTSHFMYNDIREVKQK